VYGAGGGEAFVQSSLESGLTIVTRQQFPKDANDFSPYQRALLQSGARVIVLYCQASDGGRFMRSALELGVGGEGYLWFGGDVFVGAGLWLNDEMLESDLSLRQRVLQGIFAMMPNGRLQGSVRYQDYVARRQQLPPNQGNGSSCNLETDDEGTYLWAQDHDNDGSTPLRCAGHELSQDGAYDAFGYDTVFAVAYALHDLIEVQNKTHGVGSELLDTLIKRVQFEGVTGDVSFTDASADPNRMHHGDRRVGFSYSLYNYAEANESWCPWARGGRATRAAGRRGGHVLRVWRSPFRRRTTAGRHRRRHHA